MQHQRATAGAPPLGRRPPTHAATGAEQPFDERSGHSSDWPHERQREQQPGRRDLRYRTRT
ncbi:MAG TPA: hypothetical protein VG265_00355 [Gaiellaceae bacterium]|nr:hypothetical protein [Gaiellaceae bacterium]